MKNSTLKRLFAGANIESKNNEEFVNLTNEFMASVYGGAAGNPACTIKLDISCTSNGSCGPKKPN
jgi:hypothetical protein